jgi:hypothetical protein
MAAPLPTHPPAFGVLFPGTPAGFPIPATSFTPASPTHFTLDVAAALGPASAAAAREVVLFLAAPGALPPGAALSLYVASPSGGGGWEFRGCVHGGHASEVLPLAWPGPVGTAAAAAAAQAGASGGGFGAPPPPPPPGSALGSAVLGVALEPLADATAKEGARAAGRLEFGRAVARDAFRYLESFAAAGRAAGGGVLPDGEPGLLIPASAVDRWFARFSDRLARDPDWLVRKRDGE